MQQGGGSGQLTNKVYIGWTGTQLKAQVDKTDMGSFVMTGTHDNVVLPVSKGGTGQTTGFTALNALVTSASLGTTVPSDDDWFVVQQSGNVNYTSRKKLSLLWDWIRPKIGTLFVNKSGDTMTGTIKSSKSTGTYLAGNQGHAIINSTAAAGAYTMLSKLNSTNGYFTDGVYNGNREFHYTTKSTVDAGTNAVTEKLVLLDEAGNSSFPGTITAVNYKGFGDDIRVVPVVAGSSINSSGSRPLSYLRVIAFTGDLRDMVYGTLADLGEYFYISNGNSIELDMPDAYNNNTIVPLQYLLWIRTANMNTGAFVGATARLVSLPLYTSTANVNILSLGATQGAGYTLTAGNRKVTIKASANVLVNGGFIPLFEDINCAE